MERLAIALRFLWFFYAVIKISCGIAVYLLKLLNDMPIVNNQKKAAFLDACPTLSREHIKEIQTEGVY